MLASLAGRGSRAGLHRVAACRVAERVKNHVVESVPTTASCGHVERAIGRFSFCRVSPRSPRSPRPVAAFRSHPWHCQTSRVARVGSGRACDWLQAYQPLQRRAAEDVRRVGGVQTSWKTSRPVAILSTPSRLVLRPCCAALQLARCFACARADAAYIRARRASGC